MNSSLLSKDTLRCIDYRKAAVLLCKTLHDNKADENLIRLIDTLVEICEILYSDVHSRSSTSVQRFHFYTEECVCYYSTTLKWSINARCLESTSTHLQLMHEQSLNAELQCRKKKKELGQACLPDRQSAICVVLYFELEFWLGSDLDQEWGGA